MAEQQSGSWYMRTRGRVLGPFSWSQLESLRDRGQLSQFHELSQDRQVWVNAATRAALFGDRSGSMTVVEGHVPRNAVPSSTPAQEWFYNDGTSMPGPIGAEQLIAL